jgi:hypothetical protein
MNSTKKTVKTAKIDFAKHLIGKEAIVRANVAGVHFGTIVAFDPATSTIVLKDAYRLWEFYTRDKTGSISDVAANGLKEPLSQHSIGARLDEVCIANPPGLEIAICAACVRPTLAAAAPR